MLDDGKYLLVIPASCGTSSPARIYHRPTSSAGFPLLPKTRTTYNCFMLGEIFFKLFYLSGINTWISMIREMSEFHNCSLQFATELGN